MTTAASARRLTWPTRLLLVLSLTVLVLGVTTAIRWIGPAVALEYRWEVGDETRDRVTMEMTMSITPSVIDQDLEMTIQMTSVTRVLDVDEQGNATLELTQEDVRLIETNLPPGAGDPTQGLGQPQTLVVAPDGRILESSNPLVGPEGLGSQGFGTTPLLPDEPVAPGDTWELDYEQALGFGEGGFDLHADNELVRYDEVNSVETVVVRSDISGVIDFSFRPSDIPAEVLPEGATAGDIPDLGELHYTGTLEVTGDSWVDPLTGEVLRSEGGGDVSLSFGAAGFGEASPKITMDMRLDLETLRLP